VLLRFYTRRDLIARVGVVQVVPFQAHFTRTFGFDDRSSLALGFELIDLSEEDEDEATTSQGTRAFSGSAFTGVEEDGEEASGTGSFKGHHTSCSEVSLPENAPKEYLRLPHDHFWPFSHVFYSHSFVQDYLPDRRLLRPRYANER
jgi:hypothetical protein